MLIRKFVFAGLMLAAVGLTVTVSVVIGQQPSIDQKTEERIDSVDAGTPPGAGTTRPETDPPAGAGDRLTPSADNSSRRDSDGANDFNASSEGGSPAAVANPYSSQGVTSGTAGGRSSGQTRRNSSTMQGYGSDEGYGSMRGMMGMSGMGGSGTSIAVPEDEHLETWVSKALAEYAKTEDKNDRTKRQDEIAKALDRIFDIRQQRRIQELEALEQRVQKLRVTLETREKLKADILKNRMDYLIREADGLGWGDGLPAPGRSAPTGIGSLRSSGM
jgi:hypothetical protein